MQQRKKRQAPGRRPIARRSLRAFGRRAVWTGGGLGCGLLWATLLVPGSVAGQETVSLEDAIVRAIDRSPALAQSSSQLENAESARRTVLGDFLPNLSASSGSSVQSSQRFDQATQRVVSGNSNSYNAGLSASYTLFQGGRRFAEWDRTAAEIRAAGASLEDQRYAVILQTQNAFYNALRQADLLEVQNARLERAQESLGNIRQRVVLGVATRSDTLRARLEVANARQAVLVQEVALRSARFALGRQIGAAGPVLPEIPGDMEPTPIFLTDEEIYRIAEAESPSVRAADADMEAAESALSSTRTQWWPSLNLSSGYSWANDVAAFANGNTSWNLRFSMNYQIFNGFSREDQIFRAQNSARVARLQNDDARLAARQEADAALQNVRAAELAIEIANEAVAVAAEDLRVVQARYDLAVATILDLVTSQVALEEAEANVVSARYDYLLSRAELEAILGREL